MLPLPLVLSLLAPAHAQQACAGPDCPAEAALRDALLAEGLASIDALTMSRDASGQLVVSIVSTDAPGLDRIGPRSGAVTTPIRGWRSPTSTRSRSAAWPAPRSS